MSCDVVKSDRNSLDVEAAVAYPRILFGGRVHQIRFRTERTGIWGR